MARIGAVRGRGIVKRFDGVIALDGIDLDVTPRQIHELAGPNGAGKTTLLGLVFGLAHARRVAAARGGTSPTVTDRKKSTATSSCTSTGNARNRYGSSTAWSVC